MLGNTIFGVLDGGREVDWGLVFRDLAQRLAKGVEKLKPTPICPFLFHLYDSQGLLKEDEELDYRTAKEMVGYRITPDPDSRPGSDYEGQAPTPATSLVREVLVRTPCWRRKTTYRAPEGSPPVRSGGPASPAQPEQRPQAQPSSGHLHNRKSDRNPCNRMKRRNWNGCPGPSPRWPGVSDR